MSETMSSEEVAVCTDAKPSSEKFAERKTIVYETRIDPTVIKIAGEKIKNQLFTHFGFLKPKADEVQFVSVDKYYEPYMVIIGRYSLDYYRKCVYTVVINKGVLEVILLGKKFDLNQQTDLHVGGNKTVKLEGEERLKIDNEASLILDKWGRDVKPGELLSAPSEKNPHKTLAQCGVKEIAPDIDLFMIRSRLVTRPWDISRVISEVFEVDERAVIYTPRFIVKFRNAKTGEERAVEFDGVTAEKLKETKTASQSDPLPPPPP